MLNNIKEKILKILSGELDDATKKADALLATDPEYLINSPKAVGYDSTQEQLSMFLNILFGFDP